MKLDLSVKFCPNDGEPLVPDLPAFDQYEILEKLGEGGMGEVYKVRRRDLGQIMALKILHTHLMTERGFARFRREAQTASVLSHANLIFVRDFGITDGGQPYMVMDYLAGKTLAEILAEQGSLSIPQFRNVFAQVCDGLKYAHEMSILHRDIKPSNIMIIGENLEHATIKLVDFGIAKFLNADEVDQELTKAGEVIGSPLYMSPEQAEDSSVDSRTDLYSLGCVMYESLTGAPPYVGKSALETMLRHRVEKPLPLKEASLGRDFPAGLEQIVFRLLKKNANERYRDVRELRRDLQAVLCEYEVDNLNQGRDPKTAQEAKSRGFCAAVGVKMVLPGVGLVAVLILTFAIKPHLFHQSIDRKVTKTPTYQEDQSIREWIADCVRNHQTVIKVPRRELQNEDLESLRYAADVIDLNLSSHPTITSEALKCISHLRLRRLKLTETGVTDLKYIENMTTLEWLDVAKTPLTDEGAAPIASLVNLSWLNLKSTNVSDKCIGMFTKLRHLSHINLSDCKISPAGREKILNQLPEFQYLRGKEYAAVHRFSEAMICFQRAIQLWKNSSESRSDHALDSYTSLGDVYNEAGKYSEAASIYRQAISGWESRRDRNNELFGARFRLVSCLVSQHRAKEAEVLDKEWITLARQQNANRLAAVAESQLAIVYLAQGRVREAKETVLGAITALNQERRALVEDRARVLLAVIIVLRADKKVEEAFRIAQSAAQTWLKLSPNADAVAAAFSLAADNLETKNCTSEAVWVRRFAMSIWEKENWQSNLALMAHQWRTLGESHVKLLNYDDAEACLNKALGISLKFSEPRDIASLYDSIGNVQAFRRHYADAATSFKLAFTMWQAANNETDCRSEMAMDLHLQGECLENQDKYADAESFYLQALALWKELHGKNLKQLAMTRDRVDHVRTLLRAKQPNLTR